MRVGDRVKELYGSSLCVEISSNSKERWMKNKTHTKKKGCRLQVNTDDNDSSNNGKKKKANTTN